MTQRNMANICLALGSRVRNFICHKRCEQTVQEGQLREISDKKKRFYEGRVHFSYWESATVIDPCTQSLQSNRTL